MKRISLGALLALCVVILSGCFASEEPLIDESTSATPLKPGNYIATEVKREENEAPTKVKVTTEGNVTVFTSLDQADKDAAPTRVLLRKVRGNYYAMLETKSDDKSYVYMLVQIDGSSMKTYDFASACKTLEGVAAEKKADIASYGVSRVEKGNNIDTCYFMRFKDLAKGFRAVLDAGPPELVTVLTPAT
ncbi:MAG: hypothetical protein WAW96_19400 [Alphaproteobacteria bacterium]